MGRIRKRHSAAFKAKVAREAVKQDKTIAELAKLHQVHPVQISRLQMELAWLKKIWRLTSPLGEVGSFRTTRA